MVEPLFHWDGPEPVVGQTIDLSGPEAKHAVQVRRMRVGEAIQVSNGLGLRVRGTVAFADNANLGISVAEVIREPRPELELFLVQALAKGDRDELAIQAATELGIFGVIPWQAERSISRWEGTKIQKSVERWQTIVDEAAKQALRAWSPAVSDPLSSKQLVQVFNDFELVLVLDPTAQVGLTSAKLPNSGKVALVVGPEGGISRVELELFEAAGAVRVHLGAPILRTSTAGLAAISALQASMGYWA
ncbi:MAG: 16S rRNA (uracil(1498)-N(3))-methyltransferase [Micrococcales bacterium]